LRTRVLSLDVHATEGSGGLQSTRQPTPASVLSAPLLELELSQKGLSLSVPGAHCGMGLHNAKYDTTQGNCGKLAFLTRISTSAVPGARDWV
jgi:hypothetical protein